MFTSIRSYLVAILLWLLTAGSCQVAQATPTVQFVENKNQWPKTVRFRAGVPGGNVYLTTTGFVYDWQNQADLGRAHDALEASRTGSHGVAEATLHGHAVFVDFVGAKLGQPIGQQLLPAYHNYFLGSDPTQWASRVPLFAAVSYPSIYPGTDLRVYSNEQGSLKYDFVIQPGGSPAAIALQYRGANELRLRADGTLLVRTSVLEVEEQRPYAFQEVSGRRRPVPCRYRLTGSTLTYEFPEGYNSQLPLIIDPVVVACTYSGSTGPVFGSTAGYDAAGNIYTGGLAQTTGVPVTPGAYQITNRGGQDIAISKLSPNGSTLLYATYLGGNSMDDVRALMTSSAGDLYVVSQTSSSNFPTTLNCYDNTSNGGIDIAVSRFNSTGTSLLGSTYLGGSSDDLGNDIALNAQGEAFVVGNTGSFNFPISANAFQNKPSGGIDGYVARLSADCKTLVWSTLLGGSAFENVFGIRLARNGDPVVAGQTSSSNFPTTAGVLYSTIRDLSDAFVTRLRADGRALVASSFYGAANGMDQLHSLDLDAADNPYLFGVTYGTLTPTAGAVAVPGGSIFISKLTADLRTVQLTSLLGSQMQVGFTPTAFGLDACENIHAAGFVAGSGAGMPVVNPLPNGNTGSFYTFTLSANGSRQLFGSFAQGGHAHSSTQRFDRQGVLYQVVCAPFTSFTTTPGAYSRTNKTQDYDVIAFKIDQAAGAGAAVRAQIASVDSACAPYSVSFGNTSLGTNRFRWDFGDGQAADTSRAPRHTFTTPGLYRVRLVALVSANNTCARNDTTYTLVRVKAKPIVALPQNLLLCPNGTALTLSASSPGNTYRWNTGATTASISITQPGKYSVIVNNGRCVSRDSTVVRLVSPPTLTSDTIGCLAGGVTLRTTAEPGSTYLWSTQETTASILAPTSGRYTVRITQSGCVTEKTVTVTLLRPVLPPNIITPNGDGKNDVFKPSEAAIEPGTRLRLYNRWGKEVYASDNYANDWSAIGHPPGLYYYTFENERFCTPRVKGWLEVVK